MKEKTRIHIYIGGKVQGVFFRKSAQEKARELGIAGWAKNLPDGRVEILAEGDEESVESFAAWCKKGPPLARVEHCDLQTEEYQGEFVDFAVR